MKQDEHIYSDIVSNKLKVNISTIAIESNKTKDKPIKPLPIYIIILINSVPSKSLIDTGSSDDFIGTHFMTKNQDSVQRHDQPLLIQ
jgi:hypothetical protein